MGSDDLFKKRREARTQRKHEYKPPKANSYLIVTEGERTEPLYFKGMQKLIQEKAFLEEQIKLLKEIHNRNLRLCI